MALMDFKLSQSNELRFREMRMSMKLLNLYFRLRQTATSNTCRQLHPAMPLT